MNVKYKYRYLLRLYFSNSKHYETTWINSVDHIKVGDWISVGDCPAHVLEIVKEVQV